MAPARMWKEMVLARTLEVVAPAPAATSGWAAISKVILGCAAFVVWWVFAVFPKVPFLPIGRTAGSLLGATLMVVFRVISPNHAFAAIDLSILALLFGTMVVSIHLQNAGLFGYLQSALLWRQPSGRNLLCRVCLLAALSSALFTNDTTCVVLTSFVLKLCKEKHLKPRPFLLALACSSNIGSAATPIGNPQNLVIAINSGISFGRFLEGVLPAVALGLVVNTFLLVVIYGSSLSSDSTEQTTEPGPTPPPGQPRLQIFLERLKLLREPWKHQQGIRKVCVYLVTVGMLAALLAGLSLPWTAIAAAVAMMVLDFSDAGPSLKEVNYDLLVFFGGMFIATSGFDATGAPRVFWSAVEPHSQINTASGVTVLSLVVTVLSNVVSNVPTVILLGQRVASSAGASSVKAWLLLAWVSTVAGNLTLIGSAANIIVCEQARETEVERIQREVNSVNDPRPTYNLTFWKHLKFGFLSTLIVIAVGVFPIVLRTF